MLNRLIINETLFGEEVSLADSIITSCSAEFPFMIPIRDWIRVKSHLKSAKRKIWRISDLYTATYHK